jgi:hypothetical protein
MQPNPAARRQDMPIIHQKRIYREDLRANPEVFYVFGDNAARVGLGGQAGECRGEPNALGVATLFAPGEPFTDSRAEEALAIIGADLAAVAARLEEGSAVILPLDGIGTGIAALPRTGPRVFAALRERITALIDRHGGAPIAW